VKSDLAIRFLEQSPSAGECAVDLGSNGRLQISKLLIEGNTGFSDPPDYLHLLSVPSAKPHPIAHYCVGTIAYTEQYFYRYRSFKIETEGVHKIFHLLFTLVCPVLGGNQQISNRVHFSIAICTALVVMDNLTKGVNLSLKTICTSGQFIEIAPDRRIQCDFCSFLLRKKRFQLSTCGEIHDQPCNKRQEAAERGGDDCCPFPTDGITSRRKCRDVLRSDPHYNANHGGSRKTDPRARTSCHQGLGGWFDSTFVVYAGAGTKRNSGSHPPQKGLV